MTAWSPSPGWDGTCRLVSGETKAPAAREGTPNPAGRPFGSRSLPHWPLLPLIPHLVQRLPFPSQTCSTRKLAAPQFCVLRAEVLFGSVEAGSLSAPAPPRCLCPTRAGVPPHSPPPQTLLVHQPREVRRQGQGSENTSSQMKTIILTTSFTSLELDTH